MLKLTLTLLLVASFSLSLCGEGCLKCDSQNICLFCDFTRSFVLRSGSCVLSSIPNCETQNLDGTCATCQPQHYLNPYTALCAAVPESLRLSNCARYQSLTTCSICNIGYYNAGGKCALIATEITNCSVYAGDKACAHCAAGYVLSIDKTACVKTPTVEKCSAFSSITCGKCRSGFLRNPNYFVNQLYKDYSPISVAMATKAIAASISGDVDRSTAQCELITVENCEVLETASTCRLCAEGFYRNLAGQCTANPTQGVPNCGKYTNSTFCATCKWGYNLNANGTCSASVSIQFCQEYDPAALETTCTLCAPGYYLFGYNNCIRRTFFANINLCEQYSPTLERCVSCVANYQPTDDGLVCLEKIANCASYAASSKSDRHLSCATCAPGFFYGASVRVCKPGSVKNCLVYSLTQNLCAQCSNGYFLANGSCAPHRSLKYCAVYSQATKDSCEQCHFESVLYSVSNFCYADNHIANCKTQTANGLCTLCEDGFFFDTLGGSPRCAQIPAELNCLQATLGTSVCTKCVNGFSLVAGKCFLPQEYQYKNCKNHNLSGSTNDITGFTCNQCVENSVPLSLEKSFKCIERRIFTDLILGASALDPNCSSFDFDEGLNTKTCVGCANGKVLSDGVCVEACNKFAESTLYTHQVVFYNLKMHELQDSITVEKRSACGPTIANCAVAAPVLSQNFIELRYACIHCDPGFQKVVSVHKEFNAVIHRGVGDLASPNENMIVPASECRKIDPLLLIGLQSRNDLISLCEYYEDIFLGVMACRKCQAGTNSIVYQISKNCLLTEEFSPSCVTCIQGFHPVQIGSIQQCAEVEPIANCVSYDQSSPSSICRLCLSDYYLDMGGCRLRSSSFRAQNCALSPNSDVCVCSTGMYQLTANNCQPLSQNCLFNTDLAPANTCVTCDSTVSYLDGTACKLGSVANCVEYDTSLPNTCIQCRNGFYTNGAGSACLAHNPPANSLCTAWSSFTENGCDACPVNHFLFHVKNLCMPAASIPNCLTHASQTVCAVCANGYYLANRGNRCLEIPESMNCLKAVPKLSTTNVSGAIAQTDTGKLSHQWYYDCTLCKPGYVTVEETINDTSGQVFKPTRCSLSFQWMRDTCLAPATQVEGATLTFAETKYFCTGCKDSYQPASFVGQRACLARTALQDLFASAVDTLVEDCIAYNSAGVCTECVYPKAFLAPATACKLIDTTLSPPELLRLGTVTEVDTNIFTWNPSRYIFAPVAATYCGVQSPLIVPASLPGANTDHDYACVSCLSGYLPLTNIADDYIFHKPGATSDVISGFGNIFTPIKTCFASIKNVNGMNDLTGGVVNCKYYYQVNSVTPTFGCIRCNHGYTGPVYQNAAEPGYITYCEEMSACDKTTIYSGLLNPIANKEKIDQFFSCHKCVAADQVPVAFVGAATDVSDVTGSYVGIWGLIGYKKTKAVEAPGNRYSTYEADSTDRGRAVECLSMATLSASPAAVPAGYGVLMPATNVIVPNCAMYFFNVQTAGDATQANVKTSSMAAANLAMWCAACMPGFAPTYGESSTVGKHFVVECNAFAAPACATPVGSTLNSCESGVLKYDYATDRVKLSELVSADAIRIVANRSVCLAADILGNCRICKTGYTMMRDGSCVLDLVVGCERTSRSSIFNSAYSRYANLDVYFPLAADTFKQGCAKCANGFFPVVLPSVTTYDTNICMDHGADPTSVAIFTPTGLTDVNPLTGSVDNHLSVAPTYCLTFAGIGASRACRTCLATGAMVSDGTKQWCVEASLVDVGTNCLRASSTANIVGIYATCLTCAEGFLNVGGLCYSKTAPTSLRLRANCSVFPDASAAAFSDCTTCKDEFYKDLTDPVCLPLTTQGCATGTATTCTTCIKGYVITNYLKAGAPTATCIPTKNGGATEHLSYDPNCDTFNDASFGARDLACTKCKAGFYLYTSPTRPVLHDYCQPFNGVFSVPHCAEYHQSILFGTSTYLCVTCEAGYYKPANLNVCVAYTPEVPNCVTRTPDLNECATCAPNFAVNFTRNGCYSITQEARPGFLGFCADMGECTKTQYNGLSLALSSIVSCHVCKETGKIPFAFVNAGTLELRGDLTYGAYSASVGAGKAFSLGESDQNVRCLAPAAATFGITGSFNFPANCAVGLVNINLAPSATDSSLAAAPTAAGSSVFCGACQPKFAPAFAKNAADKQISNIIVGCSAIANCDFSQTFNACELCQKGYVFGYSAARGVLYDSCVPAPENPNCFAQYSENGNNYCKTCKKGFLKNRDGFCEALAPPRCEAGAFDYRQYFEGPLIARGIASGLWGSGCQRCQEGFVGVRSSVARFACSESPVVGANELPAFTHYIQNCQNYVIDGSGVFKCAQCKPTFALNTLNRCVAQSTMLGCQLFFGGKCQDCGNTTAIANRTCATAPGISGCAIYANNRTLWEPVCTACAPGFFLEGNLCLRSPVLRCDLHANERLCNKCAADYLPLLGRNETSYCIPVDKSLNCDSFDLASLQSRSVKCDTCRPGFVKTRSQTDGPVSHCLGFEPVTGCTSYEQAFSIANSTFACATCEGMSFLSEKACRRRGLFFDTCLTYSAADDRCLTCREGYYLSTDRKTCIAFPTGIEGCRTYSSMTSCRVCLTGYYIHLGECIAIPAAAQVANCLTHLSAGICEVCREGFVAKAGVCVAVVATNCLANETPFACKTCREGFVLLRDAAMVNCVAQPDPNCGANSDVAPYACTQCRPGHFLSNGVCTPVAAPIAFCSIYENEALCARCEVGYILSIDGLKCQISSSDVNFSDPLCLDSKLVATPVCGMCAPGYYFADAVCVSCAAKSGNHGCAACNPLHPNTCYFCHSGYTMSSNGQCISNASMAATTSSFATFMASLTA